MNVLFVLLAAIGGGLLVGLAQIEHARGAELRSRQYDAADDFFQGFAEALRKGRNLWSRLEGAPVAAIEDEPDYRDFIAAIDEAELRSVRIDLLFGPESGVRATARNLLDDLRLLASALARDAPNKASEDGQLFRSAGQYQVTFTTEMWKMIETRWWRTALGRAGFWH
jgi:hypothetical protein